MIMIWKIFNDIEDEMFDVFREQLKEEGLSNEEIEILIEEAKNNN